MARARPRLGPRLLIACAATALLLAGCDKNDAQKNSGSGNDGVVQAAVSAPPPLAALPLAQGAARPIQPAPAASALPPPPAPVRYAAVQPADRYAYLDRAYDEGQTFGDAPPDYTYDYDQDQPMVWRSDDGYVRVAEELPGGGVRYYYYQPGAEQPYLVQDPDYSYGYSGGALTVVYDVNGNILSDDRVERQEDIAARYLARAVALYAASMRAQHEAVAEENWDRARARVYADQQRWHERQAQDANWHAYHDTHAEQDQAHWAPERYRRAAESARFAQAVNDAAAAARAAQALQDAQAEARRSGQNAGGPRAGQDAGRNPGRSGDQNGNARANPSASPNHGPPPAAAVRPPPSQPVTPPREQPMQRAAPQPNVARNPQAPGERRDHTGPQRAPVQTPPAPAAQPSPPPVKAVPPRRIQTPAPNEARTPPGSDDRRERGADHAPVHAPAAPSTTPTAPAAKAMPPLPPAPPAQERDRHGGPERNPPRSSPPPKAVTLPAPAIAHPAPPVRGNQAPQDKKKDETKDRHDEPPAK